MVSGRAQTAPFGPLTFEEGSPLQRVSYTPMMERADLSAPGTLTADIWLGFSNIFEQDSSATHVLFLDMERLISTTTLRYGVSERLEIGMDRKSSSPHARKGKEWRGK